MLNRILPLIVLIGCCLQLQATTYYVDVNVVGGTDDGTSFVNAFDSLQEALDIAVDGDSIRIAGGIYYPTKFVGTAGSTTRDHTFHVGVDLVLIGSIDPTTDIQDLENQHTILSGDIDQNGTLDDGNAFHVLVHTNLTNAAQFNGLHIRDGNANGTLSTGLGSPSRTILKDKGGGIYHAGAGGNGGIYRSKPIFINCVITNCYAIRGGGMYMERADPQFFNCIVARDSAQLFSGGIECLFSRPIINNCTFYANHALNGGGGIGLFGGLVLVHNSVFFANSADNGPDVQGIDAASANNSARISSQFNSTTNFIPLSGSPFKNISDPEGPDGIFGTSDDGLFPGCSSLLIANGDNAHNNTQEDILGQQRINRINIDIGAYESVPAASKFFVDVNALPGGDGLSWISAFQNLHDAFCVADEGDSVFVAKGTYYPEEYPQGCSSCEASRDYTFLLNRDIILLGSFDPITGERDFDNEPSILSGDIDENNNLDTGNVYHVFIGLNLTSEALIDGFHFIHGNADTTGRRDTTPFTYVGGVGFFAGYGGGMDYDGFKSNDLRLKNCKFMYNKSMDLGAAFTSFDCFPQFEKCTFYKNEGWRGGAVSQINVERNGIATYKECVFDQNHAGRTGGAMFLWQNDALYSNCVFSRNTAFDTTNNDWTEGGGAILNFNAKPTYTNCLFESNYAEHIGGAIWHEKQSAFNHNMDVYNCTFSGNQSNLAGGIFFRDATPTMANTVFWKNTAELSANDVHFDNGGFNLLENIAAEDSFPLNTALLFYPLNTDPFLNSLNPKGEDGIWMSKDDGMHPLNDSLIDKGNNAFNSEPLDLGGMLRVQYGIVDIGAYEFPLPPVLVCRDDTIMLDGGIYSLNSTDSSNILYGSDPCISTEFSRIDFSCLDLENIPLELMVTSSSIFNQLDSCIFNLTVLEDTSYCCSYGQFASNNYIREVSLISNTDTLLNISNSNDGYGNFGHLPFEVNAGNILLLKAKSFTANPSSYKYWRAWIDYDDDEEFEEDELVLVSQGSSSNISKSITIPTELNGIISMRIVMQLNPGPPLPCAEFSLGEVEDYKILINGCPEVLVLENQTLEGVYRASKEIQTKGFVVVANTTKFIAPQVLLENGFEVNPGVIFETDKGGCLVSP